MNVAPPRFTTDESTEEDIHHHLLYCDHLFSPRLSERVDIAGYARKLRERGRTLEAWDRGLLVGLIAVYLNFRDGSCFISNVSVLENFAGRGIAARLLAACLDLAASEHLSLISLEVSSHSLPALRLYEKFGFQVQEHRGNHLYMELRQHGQDHHSDDGATS